MRDVPFHHQSQTSDEDFLTHLRLARLPRDVADAKCAVARHFLTRKSPAWSFYSHGSPWHQTDAVGSVIEKADKLLANRFRNSWPPHQWLDLATDLADPDWSRGVAEAHTSICRHTWLCELSTAFALTSKLEYAAKAFQLMRSFVGAFPFVLDPRFAEDHDTYFGGDADTTQMTAYRLFRWTDFLHSGSLHALYGSGGASDDDVFWIVKQIWFYTMQFARLVGDELRRDNHHLLDHGHVPFVIGLAFPEFSISRELVREGARVIRHHFGHNLLPDGAYAEHSTNYQYHVLFHYTHPHGVAKANGFKLFTTKQVNALRAWVEFSARAGKPDGTLPGIGDEPGRPLHHLFGSLATPIMDKHIAAMARGLGCIPGTHKTATAAEIDRATKSNRDLANTVSEYYTTPPRRPDPRQLPQPATRQYPHGGYTFFRNAWTPDADYLAVSHFAGEYGAHAHWDMMGFTLHTRGRTLIGDPAAWLYVDRRFYGHGGDHRKARQELELPYRGYSYSVDAHNCLLINDDTLKPLSAMNHGTFWGGWPPKHTLGVFRAGGPIEVAEIANDAHRPTRHRRFVVHVVGVGFAFVDTFTARPNLAPHQYSQLIHFEGDVKIDPHVPGDGGSLRATLGDANCRIVPGTEVESRWRTWRDPYLDDVYGVPHTNGAPWVAELTRRIRGRAVYTTFLLTGEAAGRSDARCRCLGTAPSGWLDWQRDGISANALDLGPLGTILIASAPDNASVMSDELTTDADLAVAHLDARGRVRSWIMVRGRKLAIKNRSLSTGRKLREWSAG